MELGTRDTLLTVGSAIMLLVGIALIFVQSPTLTTVGIVLIVLSAIVFIVDAKDLLVKTDQNARE
jgi:ABC-type bacteriocin/lantibiotic exporter with double-glycine peptidase domain